MPSLKDQATSIGSLRWHVTLAERTEREDSYSATLVEDYKKLATVHANIRPKLGLEFIDGQQLETPLTHECIFRWRPLGFFDTVLRDIRLPNGTAYREVYRVRRIREWMGRHRYMIADIELERVDT